MAHGIARASTPDVLPAFPNHLPQALIQRISLASLIERDPAAQSELWEACRTHGFFYLDCTTCEFGKSIVAMANELEALSHQAFRIPLEKKQEVAVARYRSLFGYKAAGIVAQHDPYKRRDRGEFWNLSKDDILGQHENPVPYPPIFQDVRPMLIDFIHKAHSIGMLILETLAPRLGIKPEELASKHKIQRESGDHVRLVFGPGDAEAANTELTRSEAETRINTFAHTDFGSVTLLFNWMGGLQIENRETKAWEWVRPIPGCGILNLGDAMVEFSGGKVSSGKHRVVAAPGEQAAYNRYSVVYFVRPENDVVLESLTPGAAPKTESERWRAGEWINLRSKQFGHTINTV
ncbi:Clavaminate synthase-like protein [Hypoxylon sp. FL0543]|nr:Clavaminate synthase-like protein [Hypoxylon sp. FL0543]